MTPEQFSEIINRYKQENARLGLLVLIQACIGLSLLFENLKLILEKENLHDPRTIF